METSRTEAEQILTRFNRLMREIQEGKLKRNAFTRWEIELILDMETCDLTGYRTKEVLRRYQKAVNKKIEKEPSLPMKLSDYLEMQTARRVVARHSRQAEGRTA